MAKRRRYIDGDVQEAIEELAIETDWTPAQIQRKLEKQERFKDESRDTGTRVLSLRTTQKIVKEARHRDLSGRWELPDADDDGAAALILDVLAAVIEETEGRRQYLTKMEAAWVTRIRRAAPDLPPSFDTYRLARFYMAREHWQMPSPDLDALLAFAPWRSEERRQAYVLALQEEWVPEVPTAAPGLWRDYDGIPGEGGAQ